MQRAIKPCPPVKASLTLPGSKSYTHRALVAAALADGESVLSNALKAEDTELTAQALAQLGAGIDWQGDTIRVRGVGGRWRPVGEPIYLGNSGTSMRFFTALVALGQGVYRLTGSERLCQRPLGELLQALEQLGVQVASERGDGCPPVRSGAASKAAGPAFPGTSQQPVRLGPALHRPPGSAGGGNRDHRRTGLPPLRGPDPGRCWRISASPITGRATAFSRCRGAGLSTSGLCHRGRRFQRLVFLGRGRRHRRPGDHHQPERRIPARATPPFLRFWRRWAARWRVRRRA